METPVMRDLENTASKINPDWIITLLFVLFLGIFGVHRFYNGKIGTGVLMIFTFGGFGIWVLIDLIMILVGRFRHKNGTLITVGIPTTTPPTTTTPPSNTSTTTL